MFEFFLKYPASTWRYADFVWSSGWPHIALLLCLLLAAIVLAFSLFRQKLSTAKRFLLGTLQLFTIAIALVMLWQPALKIELMQAGENSIAYLLDTSNSMLNTDGRDVSRLDEATAMLADDSLISSDLFDASVYALAGELSSLNVPLNEPVNSSDQSTERSAIGSGLQTVLETVSDQALAAVVLLSDGADNSTQMTSEWWQAIKAAGIPVHTVGFGSVSVTNDVELADVFVDNQVGENTVVTARLRIVHNGHSSIRVRVEAGDELLYAENVELDLGQAETIHTLKFNSGAVGIKELNFSLSVDGEESNKINNSQKRILNIANNPKRILYVEGEPRWEYKFIRRALHSFGGVEVVSLLRTSSNKFYRQGVESAIELAEGFPSSREALFKYSAVIIGSMEAAELSTAQQANLHDFVSERGGSLLMLAGKNGLGDGGWGRSAVAAALPAKLTAKLSAQDFEHKRMSVLPTTQGLRTPWLKLEESDTDNALAWSELPKVNDIQSIGDIKLGGTVLLESMNGNEATPLLIGHRYGQGQSFVLGTSGTWRWQMSLPSENQWHERFWQQFLFHLASGALPQLSVDNTQAIYRDVEEIPIEVSARTAGFDPLGTGEIEVMVTTPSGVKVPTTLTADIEQPGRYLGSVAATEDGPYSVNVEVPFAGEAQGTLSRAVVQHLFLKESGSAEQFNTAQNKEFLQRVSSATGGRYIDASDKEQLADVLTTRNAGITREELLPLWNMPLLFLLMLLAKALEWFLRLRWKRL